MFDIETFTNLSNSFVIKYFSLNQILVVCVITGVSTGLNEDEVVNIEKLVTSEHTGESAGIVKRAPQVVKAMTCFHSSRY